MMMPIRRGPPRRRPYPFHMIFNGTGCLLGRAEKGAPLVITKSQDLEPVAPTEYAYSAVSPRYERTYAYESLMLGFGQKIQQGFKDQRYRYAINADLSVDGLWILGPEITTVTPATVDATNGIQAFFEIGAQLIALNGRYALYYNVTGPTFSVSKDFGSGKAALAGHVFYSNVGGGSKLLFVAMGDSEAFWTFNAASATTTWTQQSGGDIMYARDFAVVGNEFYRAHATNTVTKVDTDADPLTAANWAAANAFLIGDKASGISRLAVTATGALVVLKTDGIYTLDATGIDHPLYPGLKLYASPVNFGSFTNDLYLAYGGGFHRMRMPDFTIEEIGRERAVDNDSEVRGRITAFAGHDTLHAYAGIWDPDGNNSYLLKFGAWVRGETGQAQRIDTWHGSISAKFASKRITALYKAAAGSFGAPADHSRMFIGFSDGTIGWFTLPCVPNPAACTQYTFNYSADGQVFLPLWHGGFQADQKHLRGLTVAGLNLSTSNYVNLKYRSDPTASYTTLVDGASATVNFNTTPRERAEFPRGTSALLLDTQVVLKAGSNAATPKVTGIGLHHSVRPPLLLIHQFNVLADEGLVRRDGTPLRVGVETLRDLFRNAAGSAASASVILPDESTKQLVVIDYGEAQAWDDRLRQWRAAVQVQAIESGPPSADTSTPAYGTYSRLEVYDYTTLEGGGATTYDQLEVL